MLGTKKRKFLCIIDIPVVQAAPLHPEEHMHVLGLVHLPFTHLGSHVPK